MTTRVRITVLAQGAYASLKSTRDGEFHAVDVLLPAGRGAAAGLHQRAEEYRAKAERLNRYAAMCEEAAQAVQAEEA